MKKMEKSIVGVTMYRKDFKRIDHHLEALKRLIEKVPKDLEGDHPGRNQLHLHELLKHHLSFISVVLDGEYRDD